MPRPDEFIIQTDPRLHITEKEIDTLRAAVRLSFTIASPYTRPAAGDQVQAIVLREILAAQAFGDETAREEVLAEQERARRIGEECAEEIMKSGTCSHRGVDHVGSHPLHENCIGWMPGVQS